MLWLYINTDQEFEKQFWDTPVSNRQHLAIYHNLNSCNLHCQSEIVSKSQYRCCEALSQNWHPHLADEDRCSMLWRSSCDAYPSCGIGRRSACHLRQLLTSPRANLGSLSRWTRMFVPVVCIWTRIKAAYGGSESWAQSRLNWKSRMSGRMFTMSKPRTDALQLSRAACSALYET